MRPTRDRRAGPMRGKFETDLPEPRCPAACAIKETVCGGGVLCRIEDNPIVSGTDPSTLAGYCLADYTQCPTWRTYKEAVWDDRARRLEREISGVEFEESVPDLVDDEWLEAAVLRSAHNEEGEHGRETAQVQQQSAEQERARRRGGKLLD